MSLWPWCPLPPVEHVKTAVRVLKGGCGPRCLLPREVPQLRLWPTCFGGVLSRLPTSWSSLDPYLEHPGKKNLVHSRSGAILHLTVSDLGSQLCWTSGFVWKQEASFCFRRHLSLGKCPWLSSCSVLVVQSLLLTNPSCLAWLG